MRANGRKGLLIVSRSIWPGVRRKTAKGKRYWYWAKVEPGAPWLPLPDPYLDADAFMRKLAHYQRVSVRIAETKREGTFGALVTVYRQSVHYKDKLSSNTRRTYDRYLDRLLVAYADAPLIEMTPEDIQVRVMDANADTPAAADAMLSILRTLYKFALKRKRGLSDWTEGIEAYNDHKDREPWPANVLDAALSSDDANFRLAVHLALYTGQRPGDVCAMTWSAVQGNTISVRQQKTKTMLEIEMHPALAAELARAVRSDRHIFILSNLRGDRLTGEVFWKWCRRHSAKFRLRLGPHGLRKNATNELFDAGCSVAQVAAVTGHKSLRMLEHYGKGRSQKNLAKGAVLAWRAGVKTEQERENNRKQGKPRS